MLVRIQLSLEKSYKGKQLKMSVLSLLCLMNIHQVISFHEIVLDQVPDANDVAYMYTYTLYTEKKTWNEAKAICEETGGSLIQIPSDDVNQFMAHVRYNEWLDKTGDHWIGLAEIGERNFYWPDCSRIYIGSGYSNFKGESYNSNELCYMAHKDTRLWESKKCSESRTFICQDVAQTCNFPTSLISHIQYEPTTSEFDCESVCLDDKSCWAAMFMGSSGCNFFKVNSTSNSSTSNEVSWFKQKSCYKALIVQDKNEVPVVPDDNSNTPKSNCSHASEIYSAEPVSSTIEASSTLDVVSSTYFPCPTMTETQIYNYTQNITVTEISRLTDILNVTNEIHIVSTVYSVNMESVYITLVVTASETMTTVSTVPCSTVTETSYVCSYSQPSCSSANGVQIYTYYNDSRQLESVLNSLKKELTVPVNSTSAYQRKFVCASDSRSSAAFVGYVGAVMLAIPVLVLIILDLPQAINATRKCFKGLRKNKINK